MSDCPFKELWAYDFEYIQDDGENPLPVCLVALELRSRRRIRLWKDQFGPVPPYPLGEDSLFVNFAGDADLSCHLALGWDLPARILDLRIEYLHANNTTPPPDKETRKFKLVQALTRYNIDSIDAGEKDYWQKLVIRGEPYSDEEKTGILQYCETDVIALDKLLIAMLKVGHIRFDPRLVYSLYRGRYMAAVTRMSFLGVPVDRKRFCFLLDRWEPIKKEMVVTIGGRYGVYTPEGAFSQKLFSRYLRDRGWGWPQREKGGLDLRDKTFKAMAQMHTELEDLRQLEYTKDKLKLHKLTIGVDGFNRCWLNPFSSRTSRNQPSNARFIFGPAVWLRDFLIRAPEGWGIAYIDWIGQEGGIAASFSGDANMIDAYNSEDMYVTFGQQSGVLPVGATKDTHETLRDQFKVCWLSTQYGAGHKSLAERINQPDVWGRELLRLHHKVYRTFWKWSDNRLNHALLRSRQSTVFGWTLRFKEHPKLNSVRNFPVQAHGAEVLRLAACLGTEAGIMVCAPVHDAFLIMAPIDRLQRDIEKMQACMAEASRVVLKGFILRTDVHKFVYPDYFADPKGRGKEMLAEVKRLLGIS